MSYKYTDITVINNDFELIESDVINPCLLKNNKHDIIKALEFLNSEEKFLYIHGFLGTGKRQFTNYISKYLSEDVVKLEYYCKEATVCDDILLNFTEYLDKVTGTKTLKLNAKITTLTVKFQKMIESLKKPVLVIIHSLDNVDKANLESLTEILSRMIRENNIKVIITTCAFKSGLLGELEEDRKIFLKAFTKEIFNEFVHNSKITASDRQIEDFYALTRGYYFYTALAVKIIQAENISLSDFLQKVKNADLTFDNYIGDYYISLVPTAIRNFFWFLRALRHGISLNALAILEIYDEFSIQYLKTNLIAFQFEDTIYLHDYFAQRIDIVLPAHTEIKLHKYIIGIYEQQLKEALANRAIMISRQALRAEIEYHTQKIHEIEKAETGGDEPVQNDSTAVTAKNEKDTVQQEKNENLSVQQALDKAKALAEQNKITESIEQLKKLIEQDNLGLSVLVEIRLNLARLYSTAGDYSVSEHYYELVEAYYKNNKEMINLNYLYYEMTELLYKMYKSERAIETIKKVIYSVDTPQSLLVSACTLLGNIYFDMNDSEKAFSYYKKAVDSLNEEVEVPVLAELYFKYALTNDDKGDMNLAFEYYNKCIGITENNKYLASAYSNLASCYYENGNQDDALNCFQKAYNIEKILNNYEGIYYTAHHIAKILNESNNANTINYLIEAKQSAEFINEPFYMVASLTAMGDYYYNIPDKAKEALKEYCEAERIARLSADEIDSDSLERRINDMKLRMSENDFAEITKKYEK